MPELESREGEPQVAAEELIEAILRARGELDDGKVLTDWVIVARTEDPAAPNERVIVAQSATTSPTMTLGLARRVEEMTWQSNSPRGFG